MKTSIPETLPNKAWIPLEWWLAFQPGETWARALAYCNPHSRRTAKMFDKRHIDRRSNKSIMVWNENRNEVTGRYAPMLVNRPSLPGVTPALRRPTQPFANRVHGQGTPESPSGTARSSQLEPVGGRA